MDDVIKLISKTYTKDKYGNPVEARTERTVFCKVGSIGRTEFYQAEQTGLHPSYVFTLSHYRDYQGETECSYTDWTGTERFFTVTRTYITGDRIDLTVEERVANYDESVWESE